MSVVAEVFAGLGSGALEGIGKLAIGLREAITGEGVIPGEKRGELMLIAAQLEATLATANLELQKAQIEVNKIEAQQGTFKGGWRPFAGWAAAFAACVYPTIRLLLPWGVQVVAYMTGRSLADFPQLPAMDTTEAMAILGALLGFGGYRTYERKMGKN